MIDFNGFMSAATERGQTLVTVFLRGGADGLSMVVPAEDDDYYRARPRLALRSQDTLRLDGRFRLNRHLEPLKRLFDEGELALIHCVGSEDSTRSHFEAQDLMEHAGQVAGGWLGRFLRYKSDPADRALSTVAIGKSMPESLRGAPAAAVVETIDQFRNGEEYESYVAAIERLYSEEVDELGTAARETLETMKRIESLLNRPYHPPHGVEYPNHPFGKGLSEIARLIKSGVGLEAATIDLGGWDSHITQGTLMNPLMETLASGLFAFWKELGNCRDTTTVVVMTEFGRRLRENSAFGTDHGRGSIMMVLGTGVRAGCVLTDWPGLEESVLEGPGDLPVIINYRDVLAPVLKRHGAGEGIERIFPDFRLQPIELYV